MTRACCQKSEEAFAPKLNALARRRLAKRLFELVQGVWRASLRIAAGDKKHFQLQPQQVLKIACGELDDELALAATVLQQALASQARKRLANGRGAELQTLGDVSGDKPRTGSMRARTQLRAKPFESDTEGLWTLARHQKSPATQVSGERCDTLVSMASANSS